MQWNFKGGFYFQTMREKHWYCICLFSLKYLILTAVYMRFEIEEFIYKTPTTVLIYLTKFLFLLYIKSWCWFFFYYPDFFFFFFLLFLNLVFLSLSRETHKTGYGLWMLMETSRVFSSFSFSSLFYICSGACKKSWKFKGQSPHPQKLLSPTLKTVPEKPRP